MENTNKKWRAIRTIRLCTKDCLCLYVCPTGASDTETGQIDSSKCIGCAKCADACPSHAISMVPYAYPPQQKKADDLKNAMFGLAKSKTDQEFLAATIEKNASTPVEKMLSQAIKMSNRIMAEDIIREAGYMLPQSKNANDMLISVMNDSENSDEIKNIAKTLMDMIAVND